MTAPRVKGKKYTKEQLRELEEGWRDYNIYLIEVPEKEETMEKQYVIRQSVRIFKS